MRVTVKCTFSAMQSVLDISCRDNKIETDDMFTDAPNLLLTGAKAYFSGGGWWRISGYAWDGRDVKPLIKMLEDRGAKVYYQHPAPTALRASQEPKELPKNSKSLGRKGGGICREGCKVKTCRMPTSDW